MKPEIKGLHLIINTFPAASYPCLDLALMALQGGVNGIQFRHKGIFTREIFSILSQLVELCRRFSVCLIVNDRADIAISVHAAGVHLGQTDLPIKAARQLLGKDKIIGCTASTLEQAKQAQTDGADYVGFGHVFPTRTKVKLCPPVGIAGLKEVCNDIDIPVIAVGGINEHNIQSVCAAGVSGIALVSAISTSLNPLHQTQHLKQLMALHGKNTL